MNDPAADLESFLRGVFGDLPNDNQTPDPHHEQIARIFSNDRATRLAALLLYETGLLSVDADSNLRFQFDASPLPEDFVAVYLEYRSAVAKHEEARTRSATERDVEQITLTVLDRKRSRLHNSAASVFRAAFPDTGWDHETTRRWIAAMVGSDLPWVHSKELPATPSTIRALETGTWGFEKPPWSV